jgi:hypothetical protein
MTAWLKATGLLVKHEIMGRDGSVGGVPACFGSYDGNYEFAHIWHLVRFPLDYIRSARARFGDSYWQRMQEINGIEHPTGKQRQTVEAYQQIARHWMWCHKQIEGYNPELLIRIEDGKQAWPRIIDILNPRKREYPEQIDRVGHQAERLEKIPPITWEMLGLVEQEVRDMAGGYGYEVG